MMNETTMAAPADGQDEVVVREATIEDAEALFELIDALADYERLERPTVDARERLLRDGFGAHRRVRPYLAELNGRAVAYAITLETYSSFLALPTLFLEDVFVVPDLRRMGIGRAIFRFLAREAVVRGCGRMEWTVLDWNRPAIDFYERLGGRRLSEWYLYRLTSDQLERIAAEP